MNLLRVKDLSISEIEELLELAEEFEKGRKVDYEGKKIVANLFFEPSTRTHYSFETAELRLGCRSIDLATETSSIKKGESFYDTVKTFDSFGVDALVIRHKENEYYKQLLGHINCPILNAGDGVENHPSQTLLDLYTIKKQFGHFEGLKIVIVGDIKYSRVAHSNIEVMKRLGMEVYTAGPEEYAEKNYNYRPLDEMIDKVDVVMLLRVQNERHEKQMSLTKEEYNKAYGLNKARVDLMKKDAIIMHPAPFNRGVEIEDDIVECNKSRIFDQMHNGVFVRMAMLQTAFEK